MTEDFLEETKNVATLKLSMEKKESGKISSKEVVLKPCTTLMLESFYDPRSSSLSQLEFLKKYKPMLCVDTDYGITTTPSRQQSSQVIDNLAVNKRSEVKIAGQDISLQGDGNNRHDNR